MTRRRCRTGAKGSADGEKYSRDVEKLPYVWMSTLGKCCAKCFLAHYCVILSVSNEFQRILYFLPTEPRFPEPANPARGCTVKNSRAWIKAWCEWLPGPGPNHSLTVYTHYGFGVHMVTQNSVTGAPGCTLQCIVLYVLSPPRHIWFKHLEHGYTAQWNESYRLLSVSPRTIFTVFTSYCPFLVRYK